ncbi:hypothetical protein M8C21_030567 [Ambrosia artemisiifolia]|uniref:Post-GPI attachment to proteins factor 3 n=1 Tax=Ambrosia artemisiifolia TaxID=4212 RepID=A0AAD5GD10_AMBAR|nr:hypothetical protein M8C21_030567 [Ambrosia artemisiifolia]
MFIIYVKVKSSFEFQIHFVAFRGLVVEIVWIDCAVKCYELLVVRACVEQCEKTGCVGNVCFQHYNLKSDGKSVSDPWYLQEPLYIKWKKWDCLSGCRYQCMLVREEEREKTGATPVKYHGKWPLRRAFGIEEPMAVALSALNLAVQFHGWVSFFILVNYKLPLSPTRQTYYEYTGLWHIYGTLSMNFLFWSAVYHSRDVEMTEKLHYSSAAAILGFSLIVAILRAFSLRSEASRVMVAAPFIAFVTTHILYLNCYQLDYGEKSFTPHKRLFKREGLPYHGSSTTTRLGSLGQRCQPSITLEDLVCGNR